MGRKDSHNLSPAAEGLHMALYQCRSCGKVFHMKSKGSSLFCEACGSGWEMDEYGRLVGEKKKITAIPDWYEWQRGEVEKRDPERNLPM